MYLTQIVSRNIQSHKEVVIDLLPQGLTMFTGDNSNGKSVIIRATRDIILGHLSRPQTRADLVNRKATSGEMLYTRDDGARLLVVISREASKTYFSLTLPGQESIIRYLSEKSHRDLIRMFGWNVVEGQDISLNITEEDDALLFYKTPYKVTAQVFASVTTDPIAETTLENLQGLLKDARTCRDAATANFRASQQALSELKFVDIEQLKRKREQLQYYNKFLGTLYVPTVPELRAVPKVTFVSVYSPNIPELTAVPKVSFYSVHTPKIPAIRFPKVYRFNVSIPDITALAKDMTSLKNNTCPTCGRRLLDESAHTICNRPA